MWEEISRMVDLEFPFHVIGDFNYINGPQEKRVNRPFSDNIGAQEFRDYWSKWFGRPQFL